MGIPISDTGRSKCYSTSDKKLLRFLDKILDEDASYEEALATITEAMEQGYTLYELGAIDVDTTPTPNWIHRKLAILPWAFDSEDKALREYAEAISSPATSDEEADRLYEEAASKGYNPEIFGTGGY